MGNDSLVLRVPAVRVRLPLAVKLLVLFTVSTRFALFKVMLLHTAATLISIVLAPVRLMSFDDVGTPSGFQLLASPQFVVPAPPSHVFIEASEPTL